MNGLLIRIGIDTTYGQWNAPVDLESREFAYVPIPEGQNLTPGLERRYSDLIPLLIKFSEKWGKDIDLDLKFPHDLYNQNMHLDPDFDFLTYGDLGIGRGRKMTSMKQGDVIAFYASLRAIKPRLDKLIYALIGLFVVEEVVWAIEVPRNRWNENAHTRRRRIRDDDVIIRGKPGVSGRLKTCIPVGEWRDRAYRVRRDILDAWGGLSVKDGFIQRSAVPPLFLKPEKFHSWFKKQDIHLIQRNNYV